MNKFATRMVRGDQMPRDTTMVKFKYLDALRPIATSAAGAFQYVYYDATIVEYGNAVSTTPPYDVPALWNNYWEQYQAYSCYGCSIDVTFFNGTNNTPMIIGIIPLTNDQQFTVSSVYDQNLLDQPYCKWKILGGAGSNNIKKIKHYMTAKKMFGIDYGKDIYNGRVVMNTTSATGTPSGIPNATNRWGYQVFIVPNAGFAATDQINISIKIQWYVKFMLRKKPLTGQT